jgi:hypothetical protein
MVPILAVVGTVIVIACFILTLVSYGTMNLSGEYNVLYYILLVGLGIAIMICFTRLYLAMNYGSIRPSENPNITFETCPNYWVSSSKKEMGVVEKRCTNSFKVDNDDNVLYIIPPSKENINSAGVITRLDVTTPGGLFVNDLNSMSNEDKCKEAGKYPWSEAYAKCTFDQM